MAIACRCLLAQRPMHITIPLPLLLVPVAALFGILVCPLAILAVIFGWAFLWWVHHTRLHARPAIRSTCTQTATPCLLNHSEFPHILGMWPLAGGAPGHAGFPSCSAAWAC